MAIKRLPLVCGLLAGTLLLQGCPTECAGPNYVFAAQGRFAPEREVLQLGDTLYLESVIPASLPDQNGQTIDYSNSRPIGGTLYVFSLPPGDTIPTGAVAEFEFVPMQGRINYSTDIPFPERVQQTTYIEVDGHYKLSLGMIPKRAGTYCVALGQAYSGGLKEEQGCQQAVFELSVANANQHLKYIENFQGYPVTPSERLTMYCFQIVE